MDSILSGLFLLIIIFVTIVFAYYITTIIGKKTKQLMQHRYTQVLERTIIGVNTNITIVKVNKKIYILALQGKSIQLLDVIDEEHWNFIENRSKDSSNIKLDINNILKGKMFKK